MTYSLHVSTRLAQPGDVGFDSTITVGTLKVVKWMSQVEQDV